MRRRSTVLRELPRRAGATERMLALHARDPARYPVLLDSAATGGALGRFSLLMAAPGERLMLDRDGRPRRARARRAVLRTPECVVAGRTVDRRRRSPWPFAGGWFLYLGYELAARGRTDAAACRRRRCRLSPWPWRMRAALLHDHATWRQRRCSPSRARKPMPSGWRPISRAHARAAVDDSAPSGRDVVEEDEPTAYLDGLPARARSTSRRATSTRPTWRGAGGCSLPEGLRGAATSTVDCARPTPAPFAGFAALPRLRDPVELAGTAGARARP